MGLAAVVCGEGGIPGVEYATVEGYFIGCGDNLMLQVAVPGGEGTSIVCGPANTQGVTYPTAFGDVIGCGLDSGGNALVLELGVPSPVTSGGGDGSQPVTGGEVVGLEIGAAVLAVLAVAWCIRSLTRLFNTGGE